MKNNKTLLVLSLLMAVAAPEAAAEIRVFDVETEKGRAMKFVIVAAGRITGRWGGKAARDGGRQGIVRAFELPLQAGTRFGVKVRIPPVPKGDRLVIEQVVTRPENLADGRQVRKEFTAAHVFLGRKYRNPRYWWVYIQRTPKRDFTGTWTFRLANKGRELFSRDFHLGKPDTPARTASPAAKALTGKARTIKARSIKDCPTCPEALVIPPGAFMMGANKNDVLAMYPIRAMGRTGNPNRPFGGEKFRPGDHEFPRHRVRISYRFGIGRTEVTVGEFKAFAAETGYRPAGGCFTYEKDASIGHDRRYKYRGGRSYLDPGYPQTGRHPVVCISRADMKAYLAWLGNKTGRAYRLPTEAEWEYAARAGTDTAYSYGNDPLKLCRYANFADGGSSFPQGLLACRDGFDDRPAPVGSLEANAFGLHDVHGNVFEMVEDCYNPGYAGAPADGSAWMSGPCETYVLRSTSFEMLYEGVRSASRRPAANGYDKSNLTGFRVAVTLD